jgi:DNA repair exonuclease SbcCD nuclease subunit
MSHAIILGDVHLGKGTSIGKTGVGSNLNSRVADQLNLLDWTLEQALERGADQIIITGDVFEDPKPHPTLITMFIAWLKKCQAYNIHVHIILGNHDMLRTGTVFTSSLDIISEVDLDNVSVYKDINTFTVGAAAFTMLPFRDRKSFSCSSNADAINILRDSLVYELAAMPVTYKKILIGHLAIEGSIPIGDEIDDIANELFCPLDMFQGYDYVWMGHVHKPQLMKKGHPYIAHIGSMDISNFGETDHKKYIVIIDCDSDGNDFSIEYLPTRPLIRLSVVVPKDTLDSTEYVIDEIKKSKHDFNQSIVRVEVSLAAPELKSINKSTIEKYLTSQGAFNVTGVSESKKIALIKKDKDGATGTNTIDTKMDIVSAMKTYAQTYVDAPMRDNFTELAMEIYNTYKAEGKE